MPKNSNFAGRIHPERLIGDGAGAPAGPRATDVMDVRRRLKARKADVGPEKPGKWIEALVQFVEGRTLAEVLGFWAPGVPPMVGASGESSFLSFLEGFRQVVPALGVVTGQGPHGAVRSEKPFQDMCGARRKTKTRPAYDSPFRVLKFDEFESFFSDSITLHGALQAGSADGLPPGFQEALTALMAATRNAVLSGDMAAVRKVGADFGSLVASLNEIIQDGAADVQRNAARRGNALRIKALTDKTHTTRRLTRPGSKHVRTQKRAHVKFVRDEDTGRMIPMDDATVATNGRPRFIKRS